MSAGILLGDVSWAVSASSYVLLFVPTRPPVSSEFVCLWDAVCSEWSPFTHILSCYVGAEPRLIDLFQSCSVICAIFRHTYH